MAPFFANENYTHMMSIATLSKETRGLYRISCEFAIASQFENSVGIAYPPFITFTLFVPLHKRKHNTITYTKREKKNRCTT